MYRCSALTAPARLNKGRKDFIVGVWMGRRVGNREMSRGRERKGERRIGTVVNVVVVVRKGG